MSSTRPMRKAKLAALDKIKRCAMTLNACDKYGAPLDAEITLADAIRHFQTKGFFNLIPVQFRSQKRWFDVGKVLLYINRENLPCDLGNYPTSQKFYDAVSYYERFTPEAKQYALDRFTDEEDKLLDEAFGNDDSDWDSHSIASDFSERSEYWTPADYIHKY